LARSVRSRVDVGAISVPPVGDQFAGLEGVITAEGHGLTVSFYVDELVFLVGRRMILLLPVV